MNIYSTNNIDVKDIENVKKTLYTMDQVLREKHNWTQRLIVALVTLQALPLD